MALDELINRFRLASRELFNNHFRVDIPHSSDPWLIEERFSNVQEVLFQMMVTYPASLPVVDYGELQASISVELQSDFAPWMLNRGEDTGYWDAEPHEVTRDAKLEFIAFFDWDQLSYRDNRYVRVRVSDWPKHPDLVGKQALIESQYVRYVQVES